MKVGITGGSGFLGSHLTKKLLDIGMDVFQFEGDVTDYSNLASFILDGQFSMLVHLAGISSVSEADRNVSKLFEINTFSTARVAEAALASKTKPTLVFASTAQVYKPTDAEPIAEGNFIMPLNLYARSKYASEKILESYSNSGLQTLVLRIFNHTHKSQNNRVLLPEVFEVLKLAKSQGSSRASLSLGNLNLYRDMSSIQNFTYSVSELMRFKESLPSYSVFNICSGGAYLLKDLIYELARQMEVEIELSVDAAKLRSSDPLYFYGSNEKTYKTLGIKKPNIPSVKDFIASFLADLPPVS